MNKGSFDACVVMQCIGRREAAAKIALAEEKHTAGGRIDESKTLHVGTAGLVALEDGFRGL